MFGPAGLALTVLSVAETLRNGTWDILLKRTFVAAGDAEAIQL